MRYHRNRAVSRGWGASLMDRIAKMGVELEGGFTPDTYKMAKGGNIWHHDGSVSTTRDCSGEIVSPAMDNLDALADFITKWYPVEVNKTCGFHIHLSFKSNLDYSRLMSKRFHRYFLKQWELWGKRCNIQNKQFWERLREESPEAKRYCKRSFVDPFQQAHDEWHDSRYHQLNFCWKKHGTMENRMLPMFKEAELGIKALKFYVEFVEKWLTLQKREYGISDAVVIEDALEQRDKLIIEDEPSVIRERLCV